MRKIPAEGLHHTSPQQAWADAKAAAFAVERVTSVSGKELIATVTRQRNRNVFAREFRNHVGGNCRRVGERFVKMPDQFINDPADVRRDYELVMIRTESLRGNPRVLQLVVTVFMKADRKSF